MIGLTGEAADLHFERRPAGNPSDRQHRFEVSFARGATISCRSEEEARRLTAHHLARAHRHGLTEAVVSAVWFAPDLRVKQPA